MISRRNNFVFVHIPKNAGTSVSVALSDHFSKLNPLQKLVNSVSKRVSDKNFFSNEPLERLKDHARAFEYVEYLGDRYWQMYSFAFVRNPYERMVSLFHYIQQTTVHHLHDELREMTFAEFVEFNLDRPQIAPAQSSYLTDSNGNCLVKFIGRVENVESDFHHVCENLQQEIKLAHINRSKRKDYSAYYNAELTNAVAKQFHQDFDLLGYSTDPGNTDIAPMKLKMHPRLKA